MAKTKKYTKETVVETVEAVKEPVKEVNVEPVVAEVKAAEVTKKYRTVIIETDCGEKAIKVEC